MKVSFFQMLVFACLYFYAHQLGIREEKARQDINYIGMKYRKFGKTLNSVLSMLRRNNVNPRIIKQIEDLGYTI